MNFRSFIIVLVCVLSFLCSMPTLLGNNSYLDLWKVRLGLDLQGGSYLLLDVDTNSVLEEKLGIIKSDIANELKGKYKLVELTDGNIVISPINKDEFLQELSLLPYYGLFDTRYKSSGIIVLTPSSKMVYETNESTINQSLSIVSNRVDQTGINEASIQRYGSNGILLQMPGVQDPENIKTLLGKTAKLDFRLVYSEEIANNIPIGFVKLHGIISEGSNEYIVSKYPVISGSSLVNAQVSYDNGKPIVSIKFDYDGAKRFAAVTKKNIGKQLAIVIDDEVITAPVINDAIVTGSASISGSFTPDYANKLAILLRSGALPAAITILEEKVVGPSLGSDAIASGMNASIVAFISIVAFMIIFYGWIGLLADIALIVNIFLVISGLVLFQATLTLPGLAGMLLTIDMAVDANVLIFERIKEEYKKNKNQLISNVNNGYRLAESSIIDSHITTFVSACILFFLGSGPIKGFAVTLGLGIFASIFVSQYLTKMLVLYWCHKTKAREI